MSSAHEKINLSRDEFRNITRCLENEEFRKLFAEYCEELQNLDNREQFENEIKQLEAQRGYDVQFIKPLPGYVIKTNVNGEMKAFVNVCHCDLVGKPASQSSINEKGQKGFKWSIPYAQSHPRKNYDNRGAECIVYDVVFHSDTLHLASRNANFRNLVTGTAIDAVENSFKVSLNRENLRFPKLQYKGVPKMTVIRQKATNGTDLQTETQKVNLEDRVEMKKSIVEENYTIPSYKIIHRKDIEYYELTEESDAKTFVTVPSELEVVVELPLLKSSSECVLNVTRKELHLISDVAKCKLNVKLPYEVHEKDGSAKFNADNRTLTITLPVVKKRCATPERKECDDPNKSYAETDILSGMAEKPILSRPREVSGDVSERDTRKIIFPKFSANKMDNMIAFTLSVRNIDPTSIEIKKGSNTVTCGFANIGSGFFPCYYLFFVRFPNVNIAEVQYEKWDNNLILQVVLNSSQIDCYYAGKDENSLTQYDIMEGFKDKINKLGKEIEDDSLCIAVCKTVSGQERNLSNLSIEIKTKNKTKADVCDTFDNSSKKIYDPSHNKENTESNTNSVSTEVNVKVDEKDDIITKQDNTNETKKSKKNSRGKKKRRSLSESCCDQLKIIGENEICKYEPTDVEPLNDIGNHQAATEACSQRKVRSISESSSHTFGSTNGANMDNLDALMKLNSKYKGILKRSSFERSMSECSSYDESIFHASSVEVSSIAGSIEHSHGELSESCRKTVRFNDSIKTKLFRSNTSILAQKKKNAKKNESKRRSIMRRSSEGESTDTEDKEQREFGDAHNLEVQRDHDHDSGISLDSDAGIITANNYDVSIMEKHINDENTLIDDNIAKNKSNNKEKCNKSKASTTNQKTAKSSKSTETEFRSDMIFDIEM
ncbi:protein kintoun [Toxorhynchites rutilus septentrionalis]|uniref:protein kintoun n=1 Tax=Toxorhynchites rutilus septentrionalis TaxID=329112 RepID=UPI00247ADA63|nr:protein kintoun [Toxorhynchites rutilus septentrionalis]